MSNIGYATAAIQLGVDAILVKPRRAIGPFTAHVTIKEVHSDDLEITEQPVDQGAAVTDHAYKRPAEVVIEAMWSNSPPSNNVVGGLMNAVTGTIEGVQSIITGNSVDQIRDIYQKLLQLQESRIPFDVYTGKRHYANMLVRSLIETTDKESENALRITASLRQVLIAQVSVRTIAAPKENQLDPESTMPSVDKGVKQLGSAGNFNPVASMRAGIEAQASQLQAKVTNVVSSKVTSLLG
jgi:hypothetical protein